MAYKKFIKDIGILGLTQLISALSGIITLPVITKLLGAQNYGIWTQLLITLALISTIAPLNLPYTLIRFLAGEKNKNEFQDGIWSVVTIILCISATISLSLIFFSSDISKFFNCPQIFIIILALIVIFDCINQVFFNVFRSLQQTGRYSIFFISQELGKSGLIILTIYLGYGLFGALLSFLIIKIIGFLTMGGYIIKIIGFKLPQFLKTKKYFSFSLPTIIESISGWVIQSSDKYLIGLFLGTLFVGYYAPAYSISTFVMSFLIAPFSFLLPAVLSKFYDENKIDEVKNYLKYSLKYFLMIAIPSVFGLSILSKQILTLFTTTEFANAGYLIMPIVALSLLAMGINAIIAQVILIIKKTKISGIIAIIAAVLNVGLNFIFIPKFGIMGAAITTFIAYTVILLSIWSYTFKYFKFDIDWIFILKSIFSSIIMALFVFWLKPTGLNKTVIAIISGIFIYGILIILTKSFSQQEFELFKKIKTRFKNVLNQFF